VNGFIAEMRDRDLQKDGLRFRRNMEKTGEIMAYEISKRLTYEAKEVVTPLGISTMKLMKDPPYLITILRAGIPFYQGFIHVFDKADSGFIGAFRSDRDENNHFEIEMGYTAIGNVKNRQVILVDPMVATGKSVLKAVNFIKNYGQPAKIFIAALIGARPGYQYLRDNITIPAEFWFGTMDEDLNDKSYIVPGLGDAGDLCFGEKL
jgi:uracil phosphoribosyltransferase